MNRTFVLYYDYKNTSGNHAGMAFLAKFIEQSLPQVITIKHVPQEYKFGRYISKLHALWIFASLAFVLRKSDKIFFFEYLTKGVANQEFIAKALSVFRPKTPLYALVHLSGNHLLEYYKNENEVLEHLGPIDKVFVLGNSLKHFLEKIGFKKPIITTFHYVDTVFYKPAIESVDKDRLQVLSMGSLKRNFTDLKNIIEQSPEVDFHICMGKRNLRPIFGETANVILHEFLTESELLLLMQSADISISVLDDTVGSNVITGGMAAGLAQVVSNVGSIGDYCNSDNSILCNTTADFVAAINYLNLNRSLLSEMKRCAREKAVKMSKEAFVSEFNEYVLA